MAKTTQDDLSRWDLIDKFTAHQIALLIEGYDPNTSPDRIQMGGPKTLLTAIEAAYENSYLYFSVMTISRGECRLDSADHPFVGMVAPELPSEAMRNLWEDHVGGENLSRTEWGKLFIAYQLRDLSAQRFARSDIQKWVAQAKVTNACYFVDSPATVSHAPAQQDKALSTNERNSLLVIIAALCDYSAIKINERGAAIQIANLTDEIGAPVSSDTIGRVIGKISNALESRKK